jgi:hypothetical protein
VVAEADRKLGDHIKSLSVFNKAIIWLTDFPNSGQTNPILMWFVFDAFSSIWATLSKHHQHHSNSNESEKKLFQVTSSHK